MSRNQESYLKWGIGLSVSIVLFLLGAFQGVGGVRAELKAHEQLEGHPVQIEILERIEEKIDKNTERNELMRDDIIDLKIELEKIKNTLEEK